VEQEGDKTCKVSWWGRTIITVVSHSGRYTYNNVTWEWLLYKLFEATCSWNEILFL